MGAAAAAPARLSALAGLPQNWARQSAETAAAAMRILSDLTAQELALLVSMVRERVNKRLIGSTAEMSGRMVAGAVETGKVVLDLAAGESAVMAEGVKEGLRLGPKIGALVDFVPRGVASIVALQKWGLDAISQRTQEAAEAFSEGRPVFSAAGAASAVSQTVERFIQTQKELLDVLAQQVTEATRAGDSAKPIRKSRANAMIQVAREAGEKFIEAQKQVLAVVIQRAEEETRVKSKNPPSTTLSELTRRSVESFAAAQKSLLDLMLKPVAKVDAKPRKAAPRKTKRARKAAASAS